jgi:uncharacterized protein
MQPAAPLLEALRSGHPNLSKILILVLVVAAIWWLARGVSRKNAGKSDADPSPQQMVACSHCGLYLPRDEAIPQDEAGAGGKRFFCSEEHRRLAG